MKKPILLTGQLKVVRQTQQNYYANPHTAWIFISDQYLLIFINEIITNGRNSISAQCNT